MPTAEQRAMSALSKVNDIRFPEFTAKLVTDTVDAIVAATVRQLKSYTELVSELEEGLEAFKAKAVTNAAVDRYLVDAFPGEGGTSAVASGKNYDRALYQQIIARFGNIEGMEDPGDGTGIFSDENIRSIQNATRTLLNRVAESSFEQLRMLVQMGYARVVFTNGHIRTKLTFDVQSNDTAQRTTTDIAQSAFQASTRVGGLFSSLLGVSGAMSYSSVHVRTVNENVVNTDRVVGDILGEVEVNFATQTFPTVDVKPAASAPAPNPQ